MALQPHEIGVTERGSLDDDASRLTPVVALARRGQAPGGLGTSTEPLCTQRVPKPCVTEKGALREAALDRLVVDDE